LLRVCVSIDFFAAQHAMHHSGAAFKAESSIAL
jgi:hypothetical protein